MHGFGTARAVALVALLAHAGCDDTDIDPPSDDAISDDDSQIGSHRDASVVTMDAGVTPDGARPGDAQVTTDAATPSQPSAWTKPAPRATCGAGDRPDPSLSGLSGDVRCNLSVLGQVAAPHYLSAAWYDDCAFVNGTDGTTVLHVSPEGAPTVTTTLTTVGFRSNWESMKASPESGLLVGYEANGSTLTIYDVAKDCTQPELQSSVQLGALISVGHAGNFSPDGTIYYATSLYTASVYAMDLAMPKKPVLITDQFERNAHDLFVAHDGKRGYFAYPSVLDLFIGSFAIMDLSEVQARKPGAKGKLISEMRWEDGNTSQFLIPLDYDGKEYLFVADELGSGSCDDPKKPQWGTGRFFDISNEKMPKLVSLLKTEAQDPSNCQAASKANGGTSGFGLGTHYCNVDRLKNPRVLACSDWDAGLRVYDIRDPKLPRELAYFDVEGGGTPGLARILPERLQIWVAFTPGTFYTLQITKGSELAQILSED